MLTLKELEKAPNGEYKEMKVKEKEFNHGCFQPSCDRPASQSGLILSDPFQFSTV